MKYLAVQFHNIRDRKAQFDEINRLVMRDGGWITSIPGAAEVTMECLPGSTLPSELAETGYVVSQTGEGERIVPGTITEDIITEGSTVPIRVTHAGIIRVPRYSYSTERRS
ncbi:hypothetical protein [uncultured Bradyrhizobium sp.]|uniref:hypothetical protein n=1 Tax=uncultured Bradyrhizobium sp. TaxID=199684 RepID=UPI002617722F|nr:hypothetical protein [uncultured Bradyrhizobium sp.]